MYLLVSNSEYAGEDEGEEPEEVYLGPEKHEEVRGPGTSAKLSFIGNPKRVSHIVLGDSYIRKVADLSITEYPLYNEATRGLVLVHMPGSMGRLAGLAKQVSRRLYNIYTASFEDPENTIQIAVVMGYNDPEATLKEHFRDSTRVLMEFKHAYADVSAKVQIQLGEVLYGKSSLHPIYGQRNFVHNQLNKCVGQLTPLRLWAAQLGPDMPEKDVKPVNATNIDLRIQRKTLADDNWHHNADIVAATRDVIFDWCRGVVTEEDTTPVYTPYRYLRDYEVYLPGGQLGVNQDVFAERDRLYVQHVNYPLDETAAERLDALALPAMRLESIVGKVQRRPDERGSVFDRINPQQQQQQQQQQQYQQGRGAARGAARGTGRGVTRGRVRFQPYGGRGRANKEW